MSCLHSNEARVEESAFELLQTVECHSSENKFPCSPSPLKDSYSPITIENILLRMYMVSRLELLVDHQKHPRTTDESPDFSAISNFSHHV